MGGKKTIRDKQADGSRAWARVKQNTSPLKAAQRNLHIDLSEGSSKATPSPTLKAGAAKPPTTKPSTTKPSTAQPSTTKPPTTQPQPAPKPVSRAAQSVASIDTKTKRRLARGGLALDGRLDLHGLTLREAELALRGFVARGAAQGHVWLLVITGKGARGEGKLRTALPNWLAEPEMRAYVAAFSQAGAAHGGGGAFYLRLRKSRLSV